MFVTFLERPQSQVHPILLMVAIDLEHAMQAVKEARKQTISWGDYKDVAFRIYEVPENHYLSLSSAVVNATPVWQSFFINNEWSDEWADPKVKAKFEKNTKPKTPAATAAA